MLAPLIKEHFARRGGADIARRIGIADIREAARAVTGRTRSRAVGVIDDIEPFN